MITLINLGDLYVKCKSVCVPVSLQAGKLILNISVCLLTSGGADTLHICLSVGQLVS